MKIFEFGLGSSHGIFVNPQYFTALDYDDAYKKLSKYCDENSKKINVKVYILSLIEFYEIKQELE